MFYRHCVYQEREKYEKEAIRLAKKSLRDHPAFKALGSLERHGVAIGGKSLFQTLTHDKYLHVTKSPACPKFGLVYYQELASSFAGVRSGGAALTAKDGGQALDEDLIAGLIGWIDTPVQPGPLMEYLSVNKKEPKV